MRRISVDFTTRSVLCAVGFLVATAAVASDFDLSWHTVDGGGDMFTTGGNLELSGTIGQPDANELVMTGGSYALTGGFWAIPPCWCLADINNDGLRNGDDIAGLVDCLVATGTNCACADVDGNPGLDINDVTAFVTDLLTGAACQ